MPQTPAERRWTALVKKHDASGLTIKAFAQKQQVNPRTLAWWRSRLNRQAARGPFAELEVVPSSPAARRPEAKVVLALDGFAAQVLVDEDTDLQLLKTVLGALC